MHNLDGEWETDEDGDDADADDDDEPKTFKEMLNKYKVSVILPDTLEDRTKNHSHTPVDDMRIKPVLLVNWTGISHGILRKFPDDAMSVDALKYHDLMIDILNNHDARCEDMFCEGLAFHSTSDKVDMSYIS